MAISKEMLGNLKDENDMSKNQCDLIHCERCHACKPSGTFMFLGDVPMIFYMPPPLCSNCKSVNFQEKHHTGLPDEKEALICKCKHPACLKTFLCRPSWFKLQQEHARTTGNPWMPVLVSDPHNLLSNADEDAPVSK